MTLVSMSTLLNDAAKNKYAVGYFESWDSYSFEAILETAEEEKSPIIMGFGATMLEDKWLNKTGISFLGASGKAMLEKCSVPVAFLLNETHTLEQALKGIEVGFNTVMIDSHRWPVEDAKKAVKKLVEESHKNNVEVEAEFGSLPDYLGGEIVDAHSYMTDPLEAKKFVEETGIDCLAVAIGNVHLLTKGSANINIERLKEIKKQVDIPIAVHGGTGFPDDQIKSSIENGVSKFNVGTRLKTDFFNEVRKYVLGLEPEPFIHDIVGSHKEKDFLEQGKVGIKRNVKKFIHLYGSNEKAK
jgi:fructose-bisphosphate aldolase class II